MKIKYYSCDTLEHEEEILKMESVNFINGQVGYRTAFLCTRKDGTEFEIDADDVIEISS